jgi:hypothetical protein
MSGNANRAEKQHPAETCKIAAKGSVQKAQNEGSKTDADKSANNNGGAVPALRVQNPDGIGDVQEDHQNIYQNCRSKQPAAVGTGFVIAIRLCLGITENLDLMLHRLGMRNVTNNKGGK